MAKIIIDQPYGAFQITNPIDQEYRISPLTPISPVSRQVNIKNSVKKYFLYALEELENLTVFFEELSETPSDDNGDKLLKWVTILFGRGDLGHVSEQQITISAYTRDDSEGYELSVLLDTIMGYILDEDSTNGLATIPFYDTSVVPWVFAGGMMPFLQPSLGEMEGADGTKLKDINIVCKWGGK